MWNYQHLEVLDSILRAGSFQGAARTLHLTQSAVSQRLQALEDQVGARVLIRDQPPRPTPYGQKLLDHARRVMRLEEELDLEEEVEEKVRSITLGVNGDSLATWFFEAVSEALSTNSLVVDFIIENEDITFTRLKRGEVLGCVSSRAKPLAGCNVEKIGSMHYRLAATPEFRKRYFGDGISIETVARTPAVVYDEYDYMHTLFLAKKLGINNAKYPFFRINNSHGFLDCIRYGLAYGMAPVLQARDEFKSGVLIDLVPGKLWKQDLYWHHQRGMEKHLQKLSEALVRKGRRLLKKK